jgi:hypothetical protein
MRFLNADPIGFSGGPNWFAYADGNPISLSDPFGLCAESGGVWGSIKGAASSAANSTYQFTQQLGRDYPILADAEQAVMSNIWMLDALGPAGAIETGVANAFRSVSSVAKGGRAAVALGEDLSSAAGTRVWRNVPFGHGALADAQAGIVKPYGCTINEALDVRSLGHDMGSTHGSGLTSWTADQAWALSRQNRLGGVVLETSAPNGSVWFNQAAKGAESQVLIPGTIRTR